MRAAATEPRGGVRSQSRGMPARCVWITVVCALLAAAGASRATAQQCGNGIVEAPEECDDGNLVAGDGCDANCQVECHDDCANGLPLVPRCDTCVASICAADAYCCNVHWDDICVGETTSLCGIPCPVCGNGALEVGEQCDDGNTTSGDGCDGACTIETGWTCASPGQACQALCGDGLLRGGEQCDDGNSVAGDGCDAACMTEAGWACATPAQPCQTICGDRLRRGREQCDDGNTVSGDGCEADCTFSFGFTAPFTQCPPIGPGSGCDVLLEVTPAGAVTVLVDATQTPYDGDETVVGVHNGSNQLVASIALSSDSVPIFDFDKDGLCTPLGAPAGCPFGPTGYEGPGVFFSIHGQSAGVVYFAPALRPGDVAYFSLEDTVSWGQLQTRLNPQPSFQCYGARVVTAQPPIPAVGLTDALSTFTAHTRVPRDLCTPTNEDGENPSAVADPTHLESYALVPVQHALRHVLPRRRQLVANQFGLLLLDVVGPARLLVPTAKSLSAPPPTLVAPAVDHFTCYQVQRSKGARAFTPLSDVVLADQFGALAVTVGKPTRLCLPTNLNNQSPGAEAHGERLLCYRITGAPSAVGRAYTNNEFGPGVIYPRARHELCVPSVMAQ